MENRSTMKTDAPFQQSFPNELLGLIKNSIALHSVYVISDYFQENTQVKYLQPASNSTQKPTTYTLLIIVHKFPSKSLGDFMDDLYNKTQKLFRVYAIMYTLSKIRKRLNWGDNFLLKAMLQTRCIHKEDDSLSKFCGQSLFFHPSAYESIQENWKARMGRADYLLSTIRDIQPKEDFCSMLAVMHFALEQTCMGLLFVFWEFKPQHYSLPYLFHLCGHFTELPQTIFPIDTYGSHRMHYMLCNAHQIMRFKTKNEFSYRDSDKALNRCQLFYESAQSLGDTHLDKLQKLHCGVVEPL